MDFDKRDLVIVDPILNDWVVAGWMVEGSNSVPAIEEVDVMIDTAQRDIMPFMWSGTDFWPFAPLISANVS